MLLPALQHREGNVRAAGVASLHRVLLCPAVVEAAAAATGEQQQWAVGVDSLMFCVLSSTSSSSSYR